MRRKRGLLPALPLMAGFVYALCAPVLAWLRTLLPGLSGWLFWPLAALLSTSITLSYLLPYGRLSSALHVVGEALVSPMITFAALILPVDLLWLFWRELPVRATGWIVLTLYLILCALGLRNARRIRIKRYAPLLNKPFPPLCIALLSDLHLGAFTGPRTVERIVGATLAAKPDMVVIAGDLFDDRLSQLRHPEQAADQLRRLSSACPVFACEGNHDLFEASSPERAAFLSRAGVRLLRDEAAEYAGVQLVFRKDRRRGERLPAEALLSGLDPSLPILAVDHSPAEAAALWSAGADLVLSGHTHGGQTFPMNLLNCFRPGLVYGCRQEGGKAAVVTSGAGGYGTPIRLFVNNEVAIIDTGGALNASRSPR